jgi:hypothetical protein
MEANKVVILTALQVYDCPLAFILVLGLRRAGRAGFCF